MVSRILDILKNTINRHHEVNPDDVVSQITIENEKGDQLIFKPDMKTVSEKRPVLTFKEIRNLLKKDFSKILTGLSYKDETNFGNSLIRLIEDISIFIDKEIEVHQENKNKSYNKGRLSNRFKASEQIMKKIITLQKKLISYKDKFIRSVDENDGSFFWQITDKGSEFFLENKKQLEVNMCQTNPQDALGKIEENKDDIRKKEKKRDKRKKKKERRKKNLKKNSEDRIKKKTIQKKSSHNYSKISKLNGKALKIIKKDLINGLDFSGEFPKDDNEYDEEYRNAEEEKREKKELEELKILLQKCYSP